MFRAKESQVFKQFSAWKPPDLDCMAPLLQEHNLSLPCIPITTTYTADVVRDLNTVQHDSLKRPPPNWDLSYPTKNHNLKDSKHDSPHNPVNGFCAPQKRFLIFDQSGNHTRLFLSPSLPPQNRTFTSNVINSLCEKGEDPMKNQFLVKDRVIEEKWDENDLDVEEEGEMVEDSDEINALLYSSDSDDDNDDDDEDDEVTSTMHMPLIDNDNELEVTEEEVASSDDLPKRPKRLLDGRFKIPSLEDVESSLVNDKNSSYDDSSKRASKKVKIHEALKILESIIPGLGLKNKDPLSIIDKAIVYLKSMKKEAKDVEVML